MYALVINQINRCKPLLGTDIEVSLTIDLGDLELVSLSNRVFERILGVQTHMSGVPAKVLLNIADNDGRPLDIKILEFGCWRDLKLLNDQLIERKPLTLDLGGIASRGSF